LKAVDMRHIIDFIKNINFYHCLSFWLYLSCVALILQPV